MKIFKINIITIIKSLLVFLTIKSISTNQNFNPLVKKEKTQKLKVLNPIEFKNFSLKENLNELKISNTNKSQNSYINIITSIEIKKYLQNFFQPFITLIISGLFDRSFFITTLMTIKYCNFKYVVLLSSSFSLIILGISAVYLGIIINQYISMDIIDLIAIFLFFLFGSHMIYDSCYYYDENEINLNKEIFLKDNKNKQKEEFLTYINFNTNSDYEEFEKIKINSSLTNDEKIFILNTENDFENNDNEINNLKNLNNLNKRKNDRNFLGLFNEENFEIFKIFWKIFLLIFFSEIGDRMQISTIYLTVNYEKIYVILAVIFSSFIINIIGVFGGKLISRKISEKNLTTVSGIIFLMFGLYSLIVYFNLNFKKVIDFL